MACPSQLGAHLNRPLQGEKHTYMTAKNTTPTVLTRLGDARIVAHDDGYLLEGLSAGRWQREASFDSLDDAIERAARRYVERRMRAGHSSIVLDGDDKTGTRLVFHRGSWRMEHESRFGGTNRRGSWPSIHAALLRRGGARHVGLDAIRAAVVEVHLEAVRALRNELPESGWFESDSSLEGPYPRTRVFELTEGRKTCLARDGLGMTDGVG